jgi:branched-chain amino acid transport system permease protein
MPDRCAFPEALLIVVPARSHAGARQSSEGSQPPMSTALLAVQTLNGLQLGVLLFLIAAGLTLVFGVMDFINLAHGVQYMLGAYFAVAAYGLTQNFLLALVLALAAAMAFGLVLEFAVFRHLYARDHLDQVLATFGVILFLTEGVRMI